MSMPLFYRQYLKMAVAVPFVAPVKRAVSYTHLDVYKSQVIDRAKELFGADYSHVQPHSGSQANFAVYTALLEPGDTVLGMNLALSLIHI